VEDLECFSYYDVCCGLSHNCIILTTDDRIISVYVLSLVSIERNVTYAPNKKYARVLHRMETVLNAHRSRRMFALCSIRTLRRRSWSALTATVTPTFRLKSEVVVFILPRRYVTCDVTAYLHLSRA